MFFKRGKKKQDTVQELKPVYKLSGQNNKIFYYRKRHGERNYI